LKKSKSKRKRRGPAKSRFCIGFRIFIAVFSKFGAGKGDVGFGRFEFLIEE